MKRPFDPIDEGGTPSDGTTLEGAEFTGLEAPPPEARPKRERKHRSYMLCQVCNIQLNSAAQAQIHYNGKTHQKRLKHVNSGSTVSRAQLVLERNKLLILFYECGVNVHDGGKRDTADLLSCPHYSLQGLAIRCGAVPKPGSDAAAQDALDGSSVEGGEDGSKITVISLWVEIRVCWEWNCLCFRGRRYAGVCKCACEHAQVIFGDYDFHTSTIDTVLCVFLIELNNRLTEMIQKYFKISPFTLIKVFWCWRKEGMAEKRAGCLAELGETCVGVCVFVCVCVRCVASEGRMNLKECILLFCVLLHYIQLPGLIRPLIVASTAAQGSPLLAALPVQGRPLQTPLDLKNFLPFRLNGSSPLSLFPNFNTMDPVQKAVINHTFGVPQKKKQVISCNICHLRFNSTNQAEAHYKGHKHARKLKALEAQKNKQHRRQLEHTHGREREKERERDRGRTSAPEPLPALLEPCTMEGPNTDVPPQPCGQSSRAKENENGAGDRKPYHRNGELKMACFGILVFVSLLCDSDSVAKLDDAQSSSVILTPVSEVSSADVPISPPSQHSDGTQDTASGPSETAPQQDGPAGEAPAEKEPRRNRQHLYCPVCKVTVNSVNQLEAHNSGTKHKLMLEGQSVLPRRRGKVLSSRATCKSKRLANKGSMGVANKSFQCEVCEIHVNSETQLTQHMNSRRHKDRLAGKPPKPKYSPHSKSPPTSGVTQSVRWNGYAGGAVSAMKKVFNQYSLTSLSSQTKLALQKQLTKNLTTSFLPTPITPPTLCTVAANPLTLRHPAGAAFIQTPILGPALFRPAPGPLRATHTPVIFSPY
ncbi:hypothetical protein NFI96_032189 [Prochilodus magdalenae]|nr:hypothetical protein NFI96_032189 [Prochilodus magdalenae]